MTTPVSINRLLTTLKHFGTQFNGLITQRLYCIFTDDKSVYDATPKSQVVEQIDRNYQSVIDSIEATFNKRKVINEANQKTTITIDGRDFTIAEALLYKKHAIPLFEQFIAQADQQASASRRVLEQAQSNFDKVVTTNPPADDGALQRYRIMFEPSTYNKSEDIEKLRKFVITFKSELDGLLSEVNSATLVSVD